MKVIILTEGTGATGYGHLTRCLSICQAFEEKKITPLFVVNCDERGKDFLPNVHLNCFNWLFELEKLYNIIDRADVLIIDSYLAPSEIYKEVASRVGNAVFIDDYRRIEYPSGIIVNGAIGAEYLGYEINNIHKLLLGVKYSPIRKEFWDVSPIARRGIVKNVLITFGGQDIRNLTFTVLESLLSSYSYLRYHVVLTKDNKEIGDEIISNPNINFYYSLQAQRMLDIMLQCDVAVSAAGQTLYELARVGLPTVAIGVIENQRNNIVGWREAGFLNNELWFNQSDLLETINKDISKIIEWKEQPKTIDCDGQGARRIFKNILNMHS